MKIHLKKFLNKHKKRIISLCCTLLLLPILSFNISAQVIDDLSNLFDYTGLIDISVYNRGFVNSFGVITGSPVKRLENLQMRDFGFYDISGNIYENIGGYSIIYNGLFSIPFYPDKYDYYFLGFIQGSVGYSWELNDFYIVDGNGAVLRDDAKNIYLNSNHLEKGYIFTSKLNFGDSPSISQLILSENSGGSTLNFVFRCYIVPMLKNSNEDALNSIISAINNQTSFLGGKIDDTNNFIDKGNGSTGGIVSDFQNKDSELDKVITEYTQFESQFFEDFKKNQISISGDFKSWSWGGLVGCANWIGSELTKYYNNMGDFRQYIIYPLMLGIALFFLGRGGSIIGHLYRKPFDNTTFKQGGVFRK